MSLSVTESHTPLWFIEKAAQLYVVSARPTWLPETQVYKGMENRESAENEGRDSSSKIRPCVTLFCVNASPVMENWKGIWDPTLTVEIEANRSANADSDADQQAAEIIDLFLTATIARDLSAMIEGLSIRGLRPSGISRRASGRAWVTAQEFHVDQMTRRPLVTD